MILQIDLVYPISYKPFCDLLLFELRYLLHKILWSTFPSQLLVNNEPRIGQSRRLGHANAPPTS